MSRAQQKALRVNVLQTCMDELAEYNQNLMVCFADLLHNLRELLTDYPPPDLKQFPEADQMVIAATSYLDAGIDRILSKGKAVRQVNDHLAAALSFLT
jgi:hypothetical protein